jgi:hypothetical protein
MKFTFRKLRLLHPSVIYCFIFVEYYLGAACFCPEDDDESVARTPSSAQAITGPWGELRVFL